MNSFKKFLWVFLIILLSFQNSLSFATSDDLVVEKKKISYNLIMSKNNLGTIKNWEKYIKQINSVIEKLDEEKLKILKTRIEKAKENIRLKDNWSFEYKKVWFVVSYMWDLVDYKLISIDIERDSLDVFSIIDENTNLEDISESEKKEIESKIALLQVNLFDSYYSKVSSIVSDFKKNTNYEEKWDMDFSLKIDEDYLWKIDSNISLKNYTVKSSYIDAQISWDLSWNINNSYENYYSSGSNDVSFEWFVDLISKDSEYYLMLKDFLVDWEFDSENSKEIIEKIKEISNMDKYIKIEDSMTKNLLLSLKSISWDNLRAMFSKSMFSPYKKDWSKYYIIPTKYACDKIKELSNAFDPFNPKTCSDSQYDDMIKDVMNSWIVYYIEFLNNDEYNLWFEYIKLPDYLEEAKWNISFNNDYINEAHISVIPDQEENKNEHFKIDYKRNNYLNIDFIADYEQDWKLVLRSNLDNENRFYFIDLLYNWKYSSGKLSLKDYNYSWEYSYSNYSDYKFSLDGETNRDNTLKYVSIKYNSENLDWDFYYNWNTGEFSCNSNYSSDYDDLVIKSSWVFDKENKIPTSLNVEISWKTLNYGDEQKTEYLSWNLSLKDKIIKWNLDITNYWTTMKIVSSWEIYKNYFRLWNTYQLNDPYLDDKTAKWEFNILIDKIDDKNNFNLFLNYNSEEKEIFRLELNNNSKREFKDIYINKPTNFINIEDVEWLKDFFRMY